MTIYAIIFVTSFCHFVQIKSVFSLIIFCHFCQNFLVHYWFVKATKMMKHFIFILKGVNTFYRHIFSEFGQNIHIYVQLIQNLKRCYLKTLTHKWCIQMKLWFVDLQEMVLTLFFCFLFFALCILRAWDFFFFCENICSFLEWFLSDVF